MDEASLIQSLRDGDESAFAFLVQSYHASLVRLARLFVRDDPTAEELAQETWLAVLQGLKNFEGRSSLKTWLFTILTNKAKTRGQRENRTVSFSDLESFGDGISDPIRTVDSHRFKPDGEFAGHWLDDPNSWADQPEEKFLSEEILHIVRAAIDDLPEAQRTVITLRDVHEISSDEACNILGISETNQRVLLHRARAKVRQALEEYLQSENG